MHSISITSHDILNAFTGKEKKRDRESLFHRPQQCLRFILSSSGHN